MTFTHRTFAAASLLLLQACSQSTPMPAATTAVSAANADPASAVPVVAPASAQESGDPHQACNLLTANELSAVVGSPMVATPQDGDGVSNCKYAPAGDRGPSVEFTVMPGDGESTLQMDRDMKGHDAEADKRFAGIGDDAVVVPPSVQVRVGKDLLVFSLLGVGDEPSAIRKIVSVVKPRL